MHRILQVNTFQALLVTNEIQSFVVFNYLDDGINWNKGDASLIPAQAGFNFGEIENLQEFTFPNSKTEMISNIEVESNTNNKGQFVFRVDEGASNKTCNSNTGTYILYVHVLGTFMSHSRLTCKCVTLACRLRVVLTCKVHS